MRLKILRVLGAVCENCGFKSKQTYHHDVVLHHRFPLSRGGYDNINNLQVLCYSCHLKGHPRNRENCFIKKSDKK